MGSPAKSAFDLDFEKDMQNPEFREAYERTRARIDAVDQLIRALDEERAAQGISKAELARRVGVQPEAIRRLLTAEQPNPTIGTYIATAQALGMKMTPPKRRSRRRQPAAA
jgi:DNA-binding phage protein